MSNKTLRLPSKTDKANQTAAQAAASSEPEPDVEPATIVVPTDEQIAAYLAREAAKKPATTEPGLIQSPTNFDWKYDAPIESKPFDLSSLPPPEARSVVPVQLPPRVWGDPRLITRDPRPGPQPARTPPRGR